MKPPKIWESLRKPNVEIVEIQNELNRNQGEPENTVKKNES
jgi:hypothetical protein